MQRERTLTIDGIEISDDSECYVIAEIGHNHQGRVETCKELFRRGRRAAALDAVKLQKRDNRSLYTREIYDKPYDNENSFGATYGEHREALEFGKAEYEELQARRRRDRHHVLRHGVRRPERRLSGGAGHAGVQDRLRRPDEHAAAQVTSRRSASR